MLLASKWDGITPLMDPFCGSGTIPIEAALIAGKIAPGKNRKFAFMDWPNYKKSAWTEQVDAAISAEVHPLVDIFGSDRDEGAIQISTRMPAGLEYWIGFASTIWRYLMLRLLQPPVGS